MNLAAPTRQAACSFEAREEASSSPDNWPDGNRCTGGLIRWTVETLYDFIILGSRRRFRLPARVESRDYELDTAAQDVGDANKKAYRYEMNPASAARWPHDTVFVLCRPDHSVKPAIILRLSRLGRRISRLVCCFNSSCLWRQMPLLWHLQHLHGLDTAGTYCSELRLELHSLVLGSCLFATSCSAVKWFALPILPILLRERQV